MLTLNHSWIVPGRLACGWRPGPDALDELHREGFRVILNLTLTAHTDGRFIHGHFPIENGGVPTLSQADAFCAALDQALFDGRDRIYVHCLAGLGRTGTMLACWLVRSNDMGPHQAIDVLRRLRPGAIENELQESFVHFYARRQRRVAQA